MQLLLAVFLLGAAVPAYSYTMHRTIHNRMNYVLQAVAVEEKTITAIDAPDFYWQYRLERLASKKGGELTFSATNYPGLTNPKDLYDAYYLDLTLRGKLEGFDWEAEKKISDSEWQTIFRSISRWASETARKNKPDTSSLPANDFDLLKQFYPQLNLRDLETPFAVDEVGEKFPYRTMKDMLNAATQGKLSVPGFTGTKGSLEATEAKKALEELKVSAIKKIDSIFEDTMAFAKSPFPDEQARKHYKTLKAKLADFPQTPAQWSEFRANFEKEVDEMARLASKKADEHHGHHDDHDALSPAQEFEAKYGRNLDEMQERLNKFKSDPNGFLESSILEKFGKNGLEIWKKSQEFSTKFSVTTDAERQAAEAEFSKFLNSA